MTLRIIHMPVVLQVPVIQVLVQPVEPVMHQLSSHFNFDTYQSVVAGM